MAGQQKDFLVNVELQIQDKASLALNEFRTLIVSLEPATKLFSDALGKVGSAISELSAKSSGINTKLEKLGTSAEKSSPQVDKLTQSISKLNAEYVLLKETSNVKLAPLTSAKAVGEDGAEVAGFQKSIQAANRSLNALVKNAGLLGDSIPGLEAFQKTVSSVNKSVSSLIKNVTVLSSVAPGLEGLPASLEGASKYSMLLGETAPSLGAFQKEISAASSSARVFGTNLARVGEVLITAIPRIELAAIPINATAVAMEKAATAASFYQTEIRNLAKAYLELKAVSSVKLEPLTSRTPKTQESAVSETYANSVASASRSTSGLAQSLGNVDRRLRSINDLLSSTATKASETTESFLKLTAQINALSTAFSNAAGHAVVMNTAINQAALKTIEFSKAKKDIDALTGSVNAVAGGVRQVTSAPFSNLTSSVGGSKLALEDTSKVLDVLSHKSAFVSKILYGISENFLGVGRDSKTGLGVALSKFEELEVKLSKFNSGSITMGIGLLALGAGLVVPFAEAVKVTASLEQEMSKIQAVTAATAPTMEAIKHQALQLGKETTFSAQQAAEGFRTLALSGLSVKDTMVALPTVLNVAAAGFMTIAKAASIVTSVMQSYGMQADEIAKASDVLTKAANESNSTLEDLGVSFHYVGAVAKTAGLAFDSTVGALALLHNAGLRGSMAGTSLRGVLESLLNPTHAQAKVMEDLSKRIGGLGIQLHDASGRFVKFSQLIKQFEQAGVTTSEVFALFGQRAGPGFASLLQQGSSAVEEMEFRLINSNNAAKEMAEIMRKNLLGSWENLKSAAEALGDTIGTQLVPFFTALFTTTTSVLNAITTLADKFPVLTQALAFLAGGFGLLITALGATMFAWFMLGIGAEKGWVVMKELGSVIVKLSGALADHVFGLGLTSKAEIIAASAIQATTVAMSEEALAAATMRDISITNAAAQLAQAEATSKAAISATALADARLVAARAEASAAAATVASLEAQLAASANQNANAALLQSLSAARIDLATKEAAVTQAVTEATLANTVATNAAIEAKAAAASLQGLEALKTEAAAINAATNATIDYSTAQNAELAIQRTLAVELEKTAAQRIVAARATAASMDSLEILAGQQVREAEVRLLAAKQVENQATAQYLLTGRISDYIEVVRAEDAVNIQKTALLQAQQAQYAALSASMTAQGELTLAENALKDLQALNSLNIATATYNASLTAEQILKEESIALALANATVVEAETAALVSKTIAEKEAAASKFALTSAALEVANAELRAADAAFVLNASKENEAALSAASAKAKQLEIAAYEELIALERLEAASLKARNEALIAQTALSDLQGLAAHEEALKAEAIARIQNSTGISAETAALAERDRQMLLSAEVSEKAALDNLAHAATVSEAAKRKSDLAKASLVAAEAEAAYETQLVSSTGATENYNRVIASRVAADNAAAAASAARAEQLAAADLLEVNRLRHAEAARNLNILSTEIATKSAAARLVEAQVSAKADQEAVAALLAKKGATDAEVISKAVSRAETSAAIVVQRAHTLQIIEERAMLEGLTGVQYKETLARLVKIRAIQAETAYMATLNGLQVATITLTEALSGALAKGTAWFLAIDKAVLTYTANLFGLNAALSASSAYSLAAGNSATFMGKTMAFLKAGFFSAIATGFTLIASAVELFGKSLKFLLVASPWIALIAGAIWLLIEAYKRWWVTTDDKIKQNEEEKKSLEEKNKALLDTSKNTEEYIAELSKLLPMSDEWIAVNEKLAKLLPQLKSEFVVDSKGNLRQVVADIKEAEEASKQFKKDVNEVNFSKAQQDVKTLNLLLEEQQKNEVSLELARKRYNDAVASAKSYGISEFRSEAAVQYKVALDAINQTIATTSSKINSAKEASIDLMKAHINAGGTIDQFMQKLGISATNASDAAKEMRKTYEATANSMKSLTFGGQVGQASIQIMRGLELEKSDTVSALKEVTDKMKTVESTASAIYKNMLGLWKNNLDGMKLANQAAWDVMELRAKENQSAMVKLELDKLKMYNSTSVKWQTDLKAFYDAEIAKAKAKGLSAALLEKDFTTLRLGELKAREEHNKKSLETLLKQETELSKDILSLKRDLVGGLYELELQRLEFEGKEVNLMEQGALKKKAIEEEFVEFQKAIRNKDYEGAKAFYSEMLKLGTSLKKDFTLGSDTKESFSAMFKTAGESLRGLNIETTKSKEAAVGLINSFRASGGFNGLDDIAKKIKEIYENESKIDSSGLKKALQVDSTKLEETNSTLQKLQTHVDTLENRKVSINMKQESLKDLTDISDLLVRISQAQDSFSSSTKLSQSSKDVSEIKQSWENTRAVLESVAKTLNSNTNLSKEFGTVFLDSSSNAEEESKRLLRVFESLSGKMKTFRDDEAVKIAPKVKAGDFIAENQKDFDDIRNYMHSQFKVTIKPEFDLASHTASVQNLVKSINKALEDPGAISTQFISEKLQKDLVESFKGKTVPVGVTIEPGDTFFTLENKILELLAGVKNKVSDINNTPVSIEVQNQELTATQTLLKEILDLKQQINSTSISPSVKGPDLQLPGVNTGGLIQRFAGGGKALFQRLSSALVPGVGDKDTVPAVLTPGEFVIRKGAVAKYGEKLFHALNSGMLTLANTGGLISQSMFPSVQHFSNGGSVLNSGSGDVVNVNLLIGSKSFPVKTQAGIAKDLVNELQNAARGLSR